jgi:hypothetical protein
MLVNSVLVTFHAAVHLGGGGGWGQGIEWLKDKQEAYLQFFLEDLRKIALIKLTPVAWYY